MANKLISIGFLGIQSCYLNITREKAMRRYIATDLATTDRPNNISDEDFIREQGYRIQEFTFDDEFQAYDVWSID